MVLLAVAVTITPGSTAPVGSETLPVKADVLPGCLPGTWRLKRTATVRGKVSIIIPTCAAKGYVATCLETLRAKTAYRDFEIICIDNIPSKLAKWKKLIRKGADKVVAIPEAFN